MQSKPEEKIIKTRKTSNSFLACTVEGGVAVISINRPPVNALGLSHFEVLCRKILEFTAREDVKVVILIGNRKAFIAGFDISEMAKIESKAQAIRATMRIKHLMMEIEGSRKPIIAGISGSCFGGGTELILACHMRVATVTAQMGLPEINLATIPSFGGTVRLPKVIGRARALELILTGRSISGEEAYRVGLINRVCEDEELLPVVETLGRMLAKKGAFAVQAAIQSTLAATEIDEKYAMKLESKLSGSLIETKDFRQSMAAYLEKKKAIGKNLKEA